jgi:hypothetical protein
MSADWCRVIEQDIAEIKTKISNMESQQGQLLKILAVGLLTIVGAVVGVKILP